MRIHLPGPDAAQRTQIYDAPASGFLHEQRALLAAEERRLEIYVMDEIPIGFGNVKRIAAPESRGIVHQTG
jgi:hypothetical protein